MTYPAPTGVLTTTKTGYITVAAGNCLVPSLNGVKFNSAAGVYHGSPYNFTGAVIRRHGRPERQLHDHRAEPDRRLDGAVQLRHHGEPSMSLHRLFRRGSGRRQRGQGLTEFALVIPIFLLLVVALFDLGRAVFAYNTLTNAAREGARIAIVNQYAPSIVSRAKSQTQIVELDDPSVSVTFWQVGVRRQAGQDRSRNATRSSRSAALPSSSSRRPTDRSPRSSATSCSGTA